MRNTPKSLLADVGDTELFNCNYDYDLLDLNNHLPALGKQIIFYWQDIAKIKMRFSRSQFGITDF